LPDCRRRDTDIEGERRVADPPGRQKARLFDIDGVLTDLHQRRIIQGSILPSLVKLLEKGEPIGLNTGRSPLFTLTKVLEPLEDRLNTLGQRKLLHRVFAIAEKGGCSIAYNRIGQRTVLVDNSLAIPASLKQAVQRIISGQPYARTMSYDETKQTMISIELTEDKEVTIDEFRLSQQQLVPKLAELIADFGLAGQLRVDPTTIATDIESRRVGKALGARKFVRFLSRRGFRPPAVVGFGDSRSDYEMHEEMLRLRVPAEFIYVGDPVHLDGKDLTGVLVTRNAYGLQFDSAVARHLELEAG
jgi:hydroxymethylpyrimidine pyrophosphatase-like HAD family hydrolase